MFSDFRSTSKVINDDAQQAAIAVEKVQGIAGRLGGSKSATIRETEKAYLKAKAAVAQLYQWEPAMQRVIGALSDPTRKGVSSFPSYGTFVRLNVLRYARGILEHLKRCAEADAEVSTVLGEVKKIDTDIWELETYGVLLCTTINDAEPSRLEPSTPPPHDVIRKTIAANASMCASSQVRRSREAAGQRTT